MGLMIDGIAAVEAPDKTAEIISIKGMNIDNLEQGLGMFNVEHVSPGLGADGKPPENNLQNIHSFNTFIGRVEYVHKIYEKSDCEDERQEAYWDHVKVPFLYCRGELFDDEDHQGAKAAAAVIRHYHKRGLPIRIMFSIEGDTLDKKGGMITDSIAKHIACTIKPCNAAAISGVYSDGGKIDKSNISLQKNENYVTSFESPFFNIQSLQKAEEKLDYLPLQKMFDSPLDLVDPMQQRYHQLIDAATHHLVAAKMCEFIAKTNNTAHHINHAAEAPQHQVKAQHHAMQAAVVFGKIHGYTPKASNLFVHKDIANHMKKQYSNVDPDAIIAQHHPMDSELSMIPDEPEFLGKALPSLKTPASAIGTGYNDQAQMQADMAEGSMFKSLAKNDNSGARIASARERFNRHAHKMWEQEGKQRGERVPAYDPVEAEQHRVTMSPDDKVYVQMNQFRHEMANNMRAHLPPGPRSPQSPGHDELVCPNCKEFAGQWAEDNELAHPGEGLMMGLLHGDMREEVNNRIMDPDHPARPTNAVKVKAAAPEDPMVVYKAAKAGMTKAEVAEEMKKKMVNKLRKISQNAIKRFNKLPDQVTIDEDIKLKKSLLSKADTTIPRI